MNENKLGFIYFLYGGCLLIIYSILIKRKQLKHVKLCDYSSMRTVCPSLDSTSTSVYFPNVCLLSFNALNNL